MTPLTFLDWAERTFRDRLAVVDGERRFTYGTFSERCRRQASALRGLGVGLGDTVAILAPNSAAMLEAHYAVPMLGAVLNALNTRLDAASIAFMLRHGEAKVLLCDAELMPLAEAALALPDAGTVHLVEITDGTRVAPGMDYEALLADGDPAFVAPGPADEWDALSLCYTSGTTGDPKGVVYHHRGAFLNAISNALVFGLRPGSVYLWTLPMFHCNGWTYTWGVTAVGGVHVCLRKVDPALIFRLIEAEQVTHLCAAPIVLTMLIHADPALRRRAAHTVEIATGGAAPPSAVIEAMAGLGFRVTHLYGLTETYGPAAVCVEQADWTELPPAERAGRIARQGVRYPALTDLMVADPATLEPVPADGASLGELMVRGNTVMRGYLANPGATAAAFAGGWYRTGDLAVLHEDGYVEVKDRAKDIIISGGENISSLEVEEVLYRHPAVMEAAVVAQPDPHWGERPCAFVTLRGDAPPTEAADILAWCRTHLAGFKQPRRVVFGPLPKMATGKIQKTVLRERARSET